MRRFYREEDGSLYDRKLRRHIEVNTERRIGDHYYVNPGKDTEIVIPVEEIEEKR
jgi:hypothetical protein